VADAKLLSEEDALPQPLHGAERCQDLRVELLVPNVWQLALEQYAKAMHLGVALTDADGHLLGDCLNSQPLWGLLRGVQPAGVEECPFHLLPRKPCTCVADALANGGPAFAHDRTGLVHFAVPLELDGHAVGALIAGQVFDQYPEQLALEHAAKKLGLSPNQVWQKARLECPISRHALHVYADLLATFGDAFLHTRYHALLEADIRAERERAQELLRRVNAELERLVEERTTELKEAQHKALRAERLAAIGQMVAGLAHESRNALQRGQSCLSMLGLRVQEQPEALDLVERAQRAQEDLHRLYEEVREYAATIHLDTCVCDLSSLWREAWSDLAPLHTGKRAELREEARDIDLHCRASPFHLKQVFGNLFDNALSTGPDPVIVTIRCGRAEIEGREAVQVSVRDNGPGFTPEQREQLFEPFYTTKVRGTGLGLAICKRLMEAHGGRIEAGQNNGSGAEILMTLPRRLS
jgi:signal transduction histidine kinase